MNKSSDLLEELILELAFDAFKQSSFGAYRIYHKRMRSIIITGDIGSIFSEIRKISDELVEMYGYSQKRADLEVVNFFKKLELN